MAVENWNTNPDLNNAATPNGAAEGIPAGDLNNIAREMMADIRTWHDDFWKYTAKSADYTIVSGDRFNLIVATDTADFTLPSAASVGASWMVAILNSATDKYAKVIGSINGESAVVLRPGDAILVISDGTNYIGLSNPVQSASDFFIPQFGDWGGNLSGGYPVFDWTSDSALSDPATLPAGDGNDVAWSPSGEFLTVAHSVSPYLTTYQRVGNAFFKLANPATLPAGNGFGASWSNSAEFLAIAHTTTPFITIYQRTGTTFTKLTNPAALPAGNARGCAFSPTCEFLAVAHTTTPFITIYQSNGSATPTFTKIANPATLPTTTANDCAWSPDGRLLVVAHDSSPFITIYERTGLTTFTKLSNPATLPGGNANGVAFSPDGSYLVVAHGDTPFVTIYAVSDTTFTKQSNPATLPAGTGTRVHWSGNYFVVSHVSTPYATIYNQALVKQTNLSSLPGSDGLGCAFSPNCEFLCVTETTTPFIGIYQTGQNILRGTVNIKPQNLAT